MKIEYNYKSSIIFSNTRVEEHSLDGKSYYYVEPCVSLLCNGCKLHIIEISPTELVYLAPPCASSEYMPRSLRRDMTNDCLCGAVGPNASLKINCGMLGGFAYISSN